MMKTSNIKTLSIIFFFLKYAILNDLTTGDHPDPL